MDFPDNYLTWLKKTPSLTTFRVNLLKTDVESVINEIILHLKKQAILNKCEQIPKVYQLFDNTVCVGLWPDCKDILKNRQEVIVDDLCGAAVLRGSHVFAPGIKGLPPDIPLDSEVNIYADISGHCKRGLKIEYVDREKKYVGYGILKQGRHNLFANNAKPQGIGVETVMPLSRVPVIDIEIFPKGSCLLQNLPSIICTKVLDPQCGDTILDMCAAPGNKTTHIAEAIYNKGIIIALDRTAAKVEKIKTRCDNFSITCVHTYQFDSTKSVLKEHSVDKLLLEGPPFKPESFDRILLDAPCSAVGQRPLLKYKIDNASYLALQKKLFYAAVQLLKNSGQLVYSTCTIFEEECERMVAWALETFPNLILVPAEPLLGGPGWENCGLTDAERLMVQRFGPKRDELRTVDPIYNDTIGFFIAKFVKQQ